jgi:hypothetical protein
MNVFATEHPMTAQPPLRLPRWLKCSLLFVFCYYPLYLAMLGPFWALDGRGFLDFMPDQVRGIIYAPAGLVVDKPIIGIFFEGYMECWYDDPTAPPL